MEKHSFICRDRKAVTLVELLVAMALIVLIFAAIVPQFRAIRNSMASSEASSTSIQNGRVLEEHINRNLSAAKQIVSVSSSSDVNGFIIFKDVSGIQKRYMVSGGYVVFGTVGSEEQLAGPVSRFQVSSYSLDDVDTPITDVNDIRFVEIETDFPNSNPDGDDRTFIASAYLQTHANNCDIVGYWKMDESSGTTAADSSGSGNNGTLQNMSSPGCWVAGQIGNALNFDGNNDYVSLPIGSVISSLTNCTITSWVNWSGSGSSWQRIWDFGTGTTYYMFLTANSSSNQIRFAITKTGSAGEEQISYTPVFPHDGGWHHVAITIDADNHVDKMYLDGSYVAQKTSANRTPSDLGNTDKNYLAKSQYNDPYFNGKIDSVRIYNRVLSATEITQLVNYIRYRTFNERKEPSDTTSIAVPIPPNTSSGDLLIAAVATDGDTSGSITTAAAGWTQIDRGASSGEVTLGAWYKVAGASESVPTFNWTGGQQAYGWMMRFTGQDATNPINGTPVAASSTSISPTSPAVTTTVDNCIILRLGAFNNDDIIIDNPLLLPGHTTITADESSSGTTGIVGYWNMDESSGTTAADSSGNGRNGTLQSMSSPGCWVAGKINNALRFDGSNDYVSLPIGSLINSLTNCTIATWVYWRGGTANYHRIFDFGNNNSLYMYLTPDSGASGKPMFSITLNGSSNAQKTNSSVALSPNTWQHIAVTIDQANHTHKLYINGTLRGSNTSGSYTPHSLGTTTNNWLGRSEYPDDPYLNGSLDDFRIYNFVLTAAQITQLYQWTGGGGGTVCGGAGYLKQSTAGSSGTSNFTLGSSNEARTLTIAIAPSSNSSDDCSQIKP